MATLPSPQALQSQTERAALEYCADGRLHQSLSLPATQHHGELRVTFAISGLGADVNHRATDRGPSDGGVPSPSEGPADAITIPTLIHCKFWQSRPLFACAGER